MNIDSLNAAMSTISSYDTAGVSEGSLRYVVGTGMLDKTLDLNETLGNDMVRMMERSVNPHIGGNIDAYA